ncbi:MAG: ABC transporter permease [Bacteroidia bacterium]
MLKYIAKRVLLFIPTLIIITVIGFAISVNAPGDPVERIVTASSSGGEVGSQSASVQEQKMYWKKKLGLDLPVFYFSLSKLSYPDTLYKIYDKNESTALCRLLDEYGNWNEISVYYNKLEIFYKSLLRMKSDTLGLKPWEKVVLNNSITDLQFGVLTLKASWQQDVIKAKMKSINILVDSGSIYTMTRLDFAEICSSYESIKLKSTKWKNYIPVLHFYGNNQYHRWLFGDGGTFSSGIVRGDFGTSYQTKDAVSKTIFQKIGWSLFFTITSVFIAYLVSIPIGVRAAKNPGGRFDKISSVILFALYSLPNFFVGILLLMLFANPDMLDIFPASGVKPIEGYPDDASFFEKLKLTIPHLIIPLFCYTYSSFAFLSRIMRGALLENIQMDYIRTAYAKGLSHDKVVWKHALKNSLLPIITVFAAVFPAAVGGSVILETIFTIPGMGLEAYNAIAQQNYPMIIAVLTLTSVLTLIGYLVSDILYAVVDPRISFK